jgi:hypothetical protein
MDYFVSPSEVFASIKKGRVLRHAPSPSAHPLQSAPPLYPHRWSKHPHIVSAIDAINEECVALAKSDGGRIKDPKEFQKHLRTILLDLWAAAMLSTNPYRSISLNKSFYRHSTRYKRLFLKYDYVIKVLNQIEAMGYIEIYKGYRYRTGSEKGFNTRVKATDALLSKVVEGFSVSDLSDDSGFECIVLHDAEKKLVDYADNAETRKMRKNISLINARLDKARIALYMPDSLWEEFYDRLAKTKRRTINFLDKRMHRVFNETFDRGGRFYGGWWIEVPRVFRKYIEIDHKPTVELDYSGHHYRILYGMEGVKMEGDPYEVGGFSRGNVKKALLIMLNAASRQSALSALRSEGIKEAKALVDAAAERHVLIAKHFYSGKGLELQRRDSEVAERVMLRMMEHGAAVLPVHDSFIVRNGYDFELRQVMAEEFERQYGECGITAKPTMLEEKPCAGATYSEYYRLFS